MARPQTDIAAGRDMLVDCAIAVIEERGGLAVTIAEVAARCNMSPANFLRYFESRDALLEHVAERWFAPNVAMMEEVVACDLPPRRKMYEFFARRFIRLRDKFRADPVSFKAYHELGEDHFEIVRSYIDLADHYLAEIIGQAMGEGYFAGLSVDEALSLVNQMATLYCNLGGLLHLGDKLSEDKLARIIDAMFDGLSAQDRGARGLAGLRAA